ncbi:tRNA(Met) cytidine acetate ligase [Macrococcus carouselicus]|uniref:tRNA(Met) cytidine acetate ligase n=1 Tax=Macrococcus carouselicus TaxID=69969 RepID=A0A9Q8CI88_9STAP|nr:nucleotidyltransferase family protein [Macrococcus carouselicus]TDM03929.1 nucleotidyltransferase [Macrococcus carouselicus]
MKSVAIIAEYNPYHNGHQYHARTARAQSEADVVIAIMSGQFTQRGEPAIFDKFRRAESALLDCDLVVELPQFYALSYADDFAAGGIRAAELLRADTLAFGAECEDLSQLTAELRRDKKVDISSGESYARMMGDSSLYQPNNILAMQYVRHCQANNIELLPIKRVQSAYHDRIITGDIASATAIRAALLKGDDYSQAVPYLLKPENAVTWDDFFPYLKYTLLTKTPAELRQIYMMTEGLENRLQRAVKAHHDFRSFMAAIKTKRYTYTRLQRLLACTLLNIQQSHPVTDLRVLAMNDTGRQYIKGLPHLHTNINRQNAALFSLEVRATQVYNLVSGVTQNDFNTPVIYQTSV